MLLPTQFARATFLVIRYSLVIEEDFGGPNEEIERNLPIPSIVWQCKQVQDSLQ